MRNHGWEPPYHPLQVAGAAAYVALAFAFYIFFAPFVGSEVLEFHAIAVYSPVIIAVLLLYVKCTLINPADPGILRSKDKQSFTTTRCLVANTSLENGGIASTMQQIATPKSSQQQDGIGKNHGSTESGYWSSALVKFFSMSCLKTPFTRSVSGESVGDDDLLYCNLCESEIFTRSKHCRICDKCVDCFDHHCSVFIFYSPYESFAGHWLNNCIGKKNYKYFVALVISTISLLVLQWLVGVWILVRCLWHRRLCLDNIVAKLGNSFSLVPFIVVVASCTVLAMVATLPLGQLFCFHVVLIKKGMSTYEYIMKIREQEQQSDNAMEANPTPGTSPGSSVLMSNASSAGEMPTLCTPPHIFLDHKQSVLGSDWPFRSRELQSETTTKAVLKDETRKKLVKISPWTLARLNTQDAPCAAPQARNNSAVVCHVAQKERFESSSVDASARVLSTPTSRLKADVFFAPFQQRLKLPRPQAVGKGVEFESLPNLGSLVMNTEKYTTGPSSAESTAASPDGQFRRDALSFLWSQTLLTNDGYEASGGESVDETEGCPWNK